MCTLDSILNTEIKRPTGISSTDHGMTRERIRFNTDVMFAVAKLLELPLDKTNELMRKKNVFPLLKRSYTNRKKMGIKKISNDIAEKLRKG